MALDASLKFTLRDVHLYVSFSSGAAFAAADVVVVLLLIIIHQLRF